MRARRGSAAPRASSSSSGAPEESSLIRGNPTGVRAGCGLPCALDVGAGFLRSVGALVWCRSAAPRAGSTLAAVAALLALAVPTSSGAGAVPTFTDVPPGSAFYDEITWVAAEGNRQRLPGGAFRPANSMQSRGDGRVHVPLLTDRAGPVGLRHAAVHRRAHQQRVLRRDRLAQGRGAHPGLPRRAPFRPTEPISRQAASAFLYGVQGRPDGETRRAWSIRSATCPSRTPSAARSRCSPRCLSSPATTTGPSARRRRSAARPWPPSSTDSTTSTTPRSSRARRRDRPRAAAGRR